MGGVRVLGPFLTIIMSIGLVSTLLMIPSACGDLTEIDGERIWAMYGSDPQHTGLSLWSIDGNRGQIEYRIESINPQGTPVIDVDGRIYISGHREIYALSPDFETIWTFETSAQIESTPALGPDGSLYVATSTINYPGSSRINLLYSIDTGGSVNWVYPLGGMGSFGGPCVTDDNRIILGTWQGDLLCIHPNGTLDWKYRVDMGILSCPAVGQNGSVYFSAVNGNLYALSSEGELEWNISLSSHEYASPSVGKDGTVYYGSSNSNLYAFWPNGTLRWELGTEGGVKRGVAIGPNDEILVQSGSKLQKIVDGELEWEVGNWSWNGNRAPTVDTNGFVIAEYGVQVVGGIAFHIGAFSPGGEEIWSLELSENDENEPNSASITSNGKVLVNVENSGFHVIGERSPTFSSLWILEAVIILIVIVIVYSYWRARGDTDD